MPSRPKAQTTTTAGAAPAKPAEPAKTDPSRMMAAAMLAQALVARHPWGTDPAPDVVGAQAAKLLAGVEAGLAPPPKDEDAAADEDDGQ